MVEPGAATLSLGERLQLSASVVGPTGTPLPDSRIRYSSSNPSIVSVSSQGLLTAFRAGLAYVSVRTDHGYTIVPVDVQRVVYQIEMSSPALIALGSSALFEVQARDRHGVPMAAALTVRSNDETVASVRHVINGWDDPYEIVGLAEGEVVVTATSGGVTATATVRVAR